MMIAAPHRGIGEHGRQAGGGGGGGGDEDHLGYRTASTTSPSPRWLGLAAAAARTGAYNTVIPPPLLLSVCHPSRSCGIKV